MSRTILDKANICLICEREGIQNPIEILPDTGTLIQIRHLDGTVHNWTEYKELRDIGVSRRRLNPKRMHCPKCGEMGRIGHYFENKNKKQPSYFIVHENIDGTWGKSELKRYARCYIRDEQQRNKILKRLDRLVHSA